MSEKIEDKFTIFLKEKQITSKETALLIILMIVLITLVAMSSRYGIINPLIVLFLFSFSALLFTFSYILLNEKWYLAIVPPTIFISLYWLLKDTIIWSLYLANIYAIVFAILITLYLGTLFTWKTTWIFAILITIVDATMVFVTKFMIEAAEVGLALKLPIALILPIFPSFKGLMMLGLGDLFLAGLLAIQLSKKFGKNSALISIITITLAFFLFECYSLNYYTQPFPATLIVIAGWLPVAILKGKLKCQK
ncbi:MAG: hypothetical protein QXN95_00365 [Candidatus Bathyarchaeia archaeon]